MKTKKAIQEADEREKEIKAAKEAADKTAYAEFNKNTKEEWDKYEEVWKPAKERWETSSKPYFAELQVRLTANSKSEERDLTEVRSGWKVCPKCGTSAARFQMLCTNDKCGTNLVLER